MIAAVVHHLPAVARHIDEHGHDRAHIIPVTLTWRAARPDEVDLLAAGALWLIGWELLAHGLHAPTGLGDVMVAPDPDGIRHEIVLDPGQDRIAIKIYTEDLAAFVDALLDGAVT